jgi:hypothetical protein
MWKDWLTGSEESEELPEAEERLSTSSSRELPAADELPEDVLL